MRSILLSALGWAIVATTIFDVFRTVLWSSRGGGPITTTVTSVLRRASRAVGHRDVLRSLMGPAGLALTVLAWSAGMLVGFTLVMQMDPDGLRHATTGEPADWAERAYVVGYSVFTLGNGDFAPSTDLMRALIVLVNAVGMLLVTLSVTYLVPVIGASVASRSFASSVLSLGDTPQEAVVDAWDGHRVRLDHPLRAALADLGVLTERHLAYPVLHLFDSPEPDLSAPLAVRRLDEITTLLDAIEPDAVPPEPTMRQLRSTIARYDRTYGNGRPAMADRPDAPDLAPLRAAGIPLRSA